MNVVRWAKKPSNNSSQHEADKSLMTAMFVLIAAGLVLLFSASSVVSYARFGNTYHYFQSQLFGLGVGLVGFFVAYRVNYHFWKKYAFFFLIASILLLVMVFIPGLQAEYGTARSWISIFGQSFQPSELVKLSFLIYLATWLEAKKEDLGNFASGTFPFLIVLAIIGALMFAQPDLGTLFIIVSSAVIVFFVGGGKLQHLFLAGALGVIGLLLVFNVGSDYQSDRFKCLKDPSFSTQDKCYQINQSLIAVGSGGWFGRGLGQSRQKFMYLPEVWGDSIFAIAAEEIGFIFSTLLLLLYLFIFYRGLLIARAAPDLYGSALATGIVAWLAIQTFLNVGGMINLIPMTGVPLPFISAGGSALMSALIAMGILVNISKHTKLSYGQR